MADDTRELLAFNRGVISPRGLSRIDLERMAMSAETQTNWVPRVLGSMMIRPGLEYIGSGRFPTFPFRNIPFTFGVDDTAMLEMGITYMRVRINDVPVFFPATVDTITDPSFNSPLGVGVNDWQDVSDTNGVALNVAGDAKIHGDGTDFGIIRQRVAVTDVGIEHALEVSVREGPVRFKIGSAVSLDDYVTETLLDTGIHVLAFTPTGDYYVELSNERKFDVWVQSVVVKSNTLLDIPTAYSGTDLKYLRWTQSGDVIYVACKNTDLTGLQYNAERLTKIERRGDGRSWSVSYYLPEDGPFRVQNTSGITLQASAIAGDITLTASKPIFKAEHATFRSLWRVASQGQTVTADVNAPGDEWTAPIRVTGSTTARTFGIIVEGTFTGTIHLQFSFTGDAPWSDQGTTFTSPISTNYTDGQEGQIIYYRIGTKSGGVPTGTATVTLTYTGGSIQGIFRARFFNNSTTLFGQVLQDFGSILPSKDWWEGEWSAARGYPTAVSLHEGRLWWAGLDKIWGSVSDSYESFDDNVEGDSGPISRSIGFGPIRVIHWLLSMGRLLFGTSDNSANVDARNFDGNSPLGARSNSFDEPLTPFNFNVKTVSSRGVFVDRTNQRLYELTYNLDEQDYKSLDLSIFAPDFNKVGITQIAVQMKPDIRVHCVREDGTVGMLVFDRLENVICWVEINSLGAGGMIEDVSVLPGVVEDQVYYVVKRTINGADQRHLCKWALESEAEGGTINKMADSFVHYSGAPTTAPFTTELLHLRDETVVIWADGIDIGTDVVTAGGALTNALAVAASEVIVGLGYTAQYKSAKLAELTGIGLLEKKKVNRIGFIAQNMHYQGLQYGPDFNNLQDLPKVSRGQVQTPNQIYATYHEDDFPFGGTWDEDSRICLQAAAPRPCTILAVITEMQSVEYSSPRAAPRRS